MIDGDALFLRIQSYYMVQNMDFPLDIRLPVILNEIGYTELNLDEIDALINMQVVNFQNLGTKVAGT